MNRKHTVEQYIDIIEKIKRIKPNIKFSSDFIIGYPGETQEDFNKTVKLMSNIKFINSYSFIYSPRPGTPASNLTNVNLKIAKKRLNDFQLVAEKIKTSYRKNLVNKISTVLFENKTENGNKYFGRDEYFNSIIVDSTENLVGKIKSVQISDISGNTLFGEIISNLNEKNYAA